MRVDQPFIYDAIKTDGPRSPYKEFDPKAVSRASWQAPPPKKKQEGPLISFNAHPDSFMILPYGNINAKEMDPAVKKWIKWTRIVQLVLRCVELLCAGGLLAMTIMITGTDVVTGWIMRIAPGVAILHTVYGIYHLGRKASGRTAASSASYMLFSSFFDVSVIPFYAFTALAAKTETTWKTILTNGSIVVTFADVIFYLGVVGGALHLISLAISLYLAVTFRKITKLPPDMNPLEDNLTSRHAHKRNKSSMSTVTTVSEKRSSAPLESKRSSGAAYEDLARPPTIPFFHTRTQSTSSFSTYKSSPPPSRDAHQDLPSRQYGVPLSNQKSTADSKSLKRASAQSYQALVNPSDHSLPLPLPKHTPNNSNASPPNYGNQSQRSSQPETWFTADSFSKARGRSGNAAPIKDSSKSHHSSRSRTAGTGTKYAPINLDFDDDVENDIGVALELPNPLYANPPSPVSPRGSPHGSPDRYSEKHYSKFPENRGDSRTPLRPRADSRLNEAGNGSPGMQSPLSDLINHSNRLSGDISDMSVSAMHTSSSIHPDSTLRPHALNISPSKESFKAKSYSTLTAGPPPVMIGKARQVSGNDYWNAGQEYKISERTKDRKKEKGRDVSGKIAEEGRGGDVGGDGWGARLRR